MKEKGPLGTFHTMHSSSTCIAMIILQGGGEGKGKWTQGSP